MTKKQVIIVIINKFDAIAFQHCKRIAINVLTNVDVKLYILFSRNFEVNRGLLVSDAILKVVRTQCICKSLIKMISNEE